MKFFSSVIRLEINLAELHDWITTPLYNMGRKDKETRRGKLVGSPYLRHLALYIDPKIKSHKLKR